MLLLLLLLRLLTGNDTSDWFDPIMKRRRSKRNLSPSSENGGQPQRCAYEPVTHFCAFCWKAPPSTMVFLSSQIKHIVRVGP